MGRDITVNTDTSPQSVTDTPVIDNEYVTLWYHPDTQIVHHVFHQPTSGEPFREMVNAGVELLAGNHATRWLSDDRNNFALTEADTDWGKINWFPRALEAGWKYWALVVPADIKARMNMKEFVEAFSLQGMRIMVFTTPEGALDWLISVDAAG